MLGVALSLSRGGAPLIPSPPASRGYVFAAFGGENLVVTAGLAGRTRLLFAELPQ